MRRASDFQVRATNKYRSTPKGRWTVAKYRAKCKSRFLQKLYGITLLDKARMLIQQDFKCLVCKTDLHGKRKSHVDHDHGTKQVRGILCSLCNTGIGYFRDSPELLFSAATYLTPGLSIQRK